MQCGNKIINENIRNELSTQICTYLYVEARKKNHHTQDQYERIPGIEAIPGGLLFYNFFFASLVSIYNILSGHCLYLFSHSVKVRVQMETCCG